jgi:hypothetical protein
MTKTKTIDGKRYMVIRVRDVAGHHGCQVVAVFTLRASDGSERVLRETWDRPTSGKHRLVAREIHAA